MGVLGPRRGIGKALGEAGMGCSGPLVHPATTDQLRHGVNCVSTTYCSRIHGKWRCDAIGEEYYSITLGTIS